MAKEVVTFKVDGVDQFAAAIRQLNDKLRKRVLGAAVAAGAAEVVKEAKQTNAFKDQTGALRAAIRQRRSTKYSRQDFEVRHVGVFKNKTGKYANNKANRRLGRVGKKYREDPPEYYWRFLEFGTVRMGAKPFLRPAFQASQSRAVERLKARLSQKLEQAVKEVSWSKA